MDNQSQFDGLTQLGKFSLWFSLVAFLGLLAVLWIAGGTNDDYLQQIQNLALARKNLPVVMLVGGLLLALGTGLTTWLIVLYSTLRVAGPLYRFSKCFDAGIHQGVVPDISLRNNDFLQSERRFLQDKVTELYDHHGELITAAEQVLQLLDSQVAEQLTDQAKLDPSAQPCSELEAALDNLRDTQKWASYD